MAVKVLVFDLGRVVIDIDMARAPAYWARAAGRDTAEVVAAYATRVGVQDALRRHERASISDQEFFASLRRELELELSDAQFLAGWNDIFTGEVAGIAPLLAQAAARYPLYALSNTNAAHHAHFAVRHAHVLQHFSKIYLSHEMGMRKPDAEIFAALVRDIGVAPHEVLFFDDLIANVEAARQCGLRATLVRTSEDVRSAIAAL